MHTLNHVSFQLQLGDNKLSGGLDAISGCSKLGQLGLAGNKIRELEDLKPLVWITCLYRVCVLSALYIQSSLTSLVSLDLYNCPITSLEEYRSQVFQLLPSLQFLDGVNERGEELESEGEEDGEEDGEEEEEEEPGLDYLLNNDLASVS
jgi:Leucine-rich repeat (LRR) protein